MEKGKITFASFEDVKDINLDNYDIKLQIVRFINKGMLSGFIHVPQLAPSEELFKQTMYKWKKFKLSNEEKALLRKGNTGTWFDLYEIAFLKELGKYNSNELQFNIPYLNNVKKRKDLITAYNRIKEHLNNNKNIIAICYCENYKKCHRFLLGQELIKEGYSVEFL